eukprot:COSAG04_NODE_3028_length_3257_cov_2.112413_3_plen_311_part_00
MYRRGCVAALAVAISRRRRIGCGRARALPRPAEPRQKTKFRAVLRVVMRIVSNLRSCFHLRVAREPLAPLRHTPHQRTLRPFRAGSLTCGAGAGLGGGRSGARAAGGGGAAGPHRPDLLVRRLVTNKPSVMACLVVFSRQRGKLRNEHNCCSKQKMDEFGCECAREWPRSARRRRRKAHAPGNSAELCAAHAPAGYKTHAVTVVRPKVDGQGTFVLVKMFEQRKAPKIIWPKIISPKVPRLNLILAALRRVLNMIDDKGVCRAPLRSARAAARTTPARPPRPAASPTACPWLRAWAAAREGWSRRRPAGT